MDPLKRIRFQRASSAAFVSSTSKGNSGVISGSLTGKEARNIYEEVLSQPLVRSLRDESRGRGAADRKKKSSSVSNPQIRKRHGAETKNTLLLLHAQEGNLRELKKLFRDHDLSSNINVSDRFKWTALMCAVCAGHSKVVQYLLKMGADCTLVNDRGQTAHDLARAKNFPGILQILDGASRADSNANENTSKEKRLQLRKNEFFCGACGRSFKSTTMAEHETSTVHLLNAQPMEKRTWYHLNESNKGYRMLVQDGWDKDRGLGPEGKEGMKFPVKTVLKRDRKCLGADKNQESKPRVTHFKPYDLDAVRRPKIEKKVKQDIKGPKVSKKQLEKNRRKEKQWEIDFRRSFSIG